MFLKNSIETKVHDLRMIVYGELYKLYTIFIEVEQKGLVPYLEIEYIIHETDKNASFTNFLYTVEEKMYKILLINENYEKVDPTE
jgi:hypothetical protein